MVNQIPASMSLSPTPDTIAVGAGDEFTVGGIDQFGVALDDPTVNWSVAGTDTGTINDAGWYDAPTDTSGTFTVTAAIGASTATSSVIVPATTPDLTAGEASDGSHIDVNWDFDDTAPDNAAGFDVLREVNNSGTFTELSNITDPTTTGYTDTDVSNGNTYTYLLKPYALVDGSKVFGTATEPVSVSMVGMINATPSTDPILVTSRGTAGSAVSISLPFTDSNSADTHTGLDRSKGT